MAVTSVVVLLACGGEPGSAGGGGASGGGSAGGGTAAIDGGAETFSFFVTSLEAMRSLSGSDAGFGGDLRFGETGVGAGLRGADKLCATIAEGAVPGSGTKAWRAFLSASVSADGGTSPEHAIERIGPGPWYDRSGRLVAQDVAALLVSPRPTTAIFADLPNETGLGNHQGVDNHDTLTGSNAQGRLQSGATCSDWTVKTSTAGQPRIGHSWPRNATNLNMGGNWMSDHTAPGCAPGVTFGNAMNGTVGGGGGYGGLYCFARAP